MGYKFSLAVFCRSHHNFLCSGDDIQNEQGGYEVYIELDNQYFKIYVYY